MEERYSTVYARDVMEFVTVAAEFCAYLEQSECRRQAEFVETTLKLLPLLYLKASLLPRREEQEDFWMEEFVTEQDYEWLQGVIRNVMGDNDTYMDLCSDESAGYDEVAAKTVSEDLADIYQAVRNFVGAYQTGNEDNMQEAVAIVASRFELYWGQTLVNVMRALHRVRYTLIEEEEECGCKHEECHCGHHKHSEE